MKPEQITASFFEVINNQPELFAGEAQQDLTQLDIAIDQAEYIPEENKTEFLSDAIIDFCDVNPSIYKALSENLKKLQTETSEGITEEKRLLLSKKIRNLMSFDSYI
ncbi:MAG: hypothetical protein KA714_12100 [Limnoraphis sp. WC205]|jgi:hypothetical protein|nr:hypothetical protein [Limnoraphis sp. WC205]